MTAGEPVATEAPPGAAALQGRAVGDTVFKVALTVAVLAVPALLGFLVWELWVGSRLAIERYGLDFISGSTWDPVAEEFGALPLIVGTLSSAAIALVIAVPLSLGVAIYLTEFSPKWLRQPVSFVIELLAAIPSVVYGLWGIFVVIPSLRPIELWLHDHLGWIPFFGTPPSGPGLLPASVVLAIMVLPTVSALSREALVSVPYKLKEAAFGLGATRWEAIVGVLIPTALTGIFGSIMLGFGRALGETMALAMLVGNANTFTLSLFSPGTTLAALLALNFPEARGLEAQVLMYAALVLLTITLSVNVVGTAIVTRASNRLRGIR